MSRPSTKNQTTWRPKTMDARKSRDKVVANERNQHQQSDRNEMAEQNNKGKKQRIDDEVADENIEKTNDVAVHNVEADGRSREAICEAVVGDNGLAHGANGANAVKSAAVLGSVEANCVAPLLNDDKNNETHGAVVRCNETMHGANVVCAACGDKAVGNDAAAHAANISNEAKVATVLANVEANGVSRHPRNDKQKNSHAARPDDDDSMQQHNYENPCSSSWQIGQMVHEKKAEKKKTK